MKSLKQLSFIGLAITLVLTSCTMEKRVYMSGYHIEWNKSKHNPDRQELVSNDNGKQTEQNQIVTGKQSEIETSTVDNFPTVIEDNLSASIDNSVIIPSRKTVSFNKKENTVTAKINLNSVTKTIVKADSKENKKANKKSAANGGGKSQLVALLLCIFIGVLGIHRFYLGYTGIGILMLLTGGVCGILALIDLIRIITGDLKPRNGDYSEKL